MRALSCFFFFFFFFFFWLMRRKGVDSGADDGSGLEVADDSGLSAHHHRLFPRPAQLAERFRRLRLFDDSGRRQCRLRSAESHRSAAVGNTRGELCLVSVDQLFECFDSNTHSFPWKSFSNTSKILIVPELFIMQLLLELSWSIWHVLFEGVSGTGQSTVGSGFPADYFAQQAFSQR